MAEPYSLPDERGYFGPFGGRLVPEALMPALEQLAREHDTAKTDPAFIQELTELQRNYGGRPTPLYYAQRLSEYAGGAKIWLKREDLAHTGSHKLANVLGQGLLAKRMGKPRLIAETGAGQHGVATATIAALLGLECTVYMGAEDVRRQRLNVVRMEMLGTTVRPVHAGSQSLKDAINEAMRDWVANVETTHYLIGSVMGPDPFPRMVRDFVKVVSDELLWQTQELMGGLPDAVVACVGGGSNAMGSFYGFIDHPSVALVGCEAAGDGIETGRHAATISGGSPGVLHGKYTYVLQDDYGQVIPTHSISAGLDYPGVGPEHAYLHHIGRASYQGVTNAQALEGFGLLCRLEGIIPALESSHAVLPAIDLAKRIGPGGNVIMTLSGRGDKDVDEIALILDHTRTHPGAVSFGDNPATDHDEEA